MREKELRLALICYGGISLAVYMHGITKEIWHLLSASRTFQDGNATGSESEAAYHQLLGLISKHCGLKVRVLADIIAGASAGGINGVFLAQAITSGESLDPLTDLWLTEADVDKLLDPDARPLSRMTKFWATPLAWLATGKRGGAMEVDAATDERDEVRAKLTGFVRARWFEPPFGGEVFSHMLLDAFSAMKRAPKGPTLLPPNQPLDLFVTVTDFHGHEERLRLHSPQEVKENEHRLTISFCSDQSSPQLGDAASLAFAARSTASFPGAFPPFTVRELDQALAKRRETWPERDVFLQQILPLNSTKSADQLVLIDGSVLANAPFKPAIDALRDRPAKREVDRRFVYIDPKPGIRSVSLTRKGEATLPGFFATIFRAMSDIPREQPIRDNLEAIEGRSARIRRMQRVVDAIEPEVDDIIQTLFGRTFFLDRPNAARLQAWRAKAQERSARDAGHSYAAYAHVKLSGVVEEIVGLSARLDRNLHGAAYDQLRQSIWSEVRRLEIDKVSLGAGKGASPQAIGFFRSQDIRYRIRRLRFVARKLVHMIEEGVATEAIFAPLQTVVYAQLAAFLDQESARLLSPLDANDPTSLLSALASQRDLISLDRQTDDHLAEAFALVPKDFRRAPLMAYLGFPYFDISTLPMLQGEGLDEFDPIKVDRIAPDDASAIRRGGAKATLKGIQLNSFGAFFSRAYRENDYLWGRLHGAERLIDIVRSTAPGQAALPDSEIETLRRSAFLAILKEEEPRLKSIPELFATIRREIDAAGLAKPDSLA